MNTLEKAIDAIKLAEASLHPKTAPRWDKDEIEKARKRTSEGLLLAIQLLEEREGE
jgi:hypothetical protein